MGISPINSSLLHNTERAIQLTTGELSSGKKDRKKDPAGSSIADRLDLLARSLQQANRNIDASRGQLDFARGGVSNSRESVSKIKELTLQYKNAQSAEDKAIIKEQIDAEVQNIDATANQKFNGTTPLKTNSSTEVQVGDEAGETIVVSAADTSAQGLGISGFNPDDANALQQLDDASHDLDLVESRLASTEARLDHAANSNANRSQAAEAARSQIEDIDAASIFAEKTKNEILQRAQVAIVAQGGASSSALFRLVGK